MARMICLAVALCAVLVPATCGAAVINGNFETGTLSGWTPIGSAKAMGLSIGVAPPEGSFQGFLETTGNYTAPASAVVGSLGVPGSAIMGLGAGSPTNGSGFSQVITVAAGDTLSFDWNFLTDELDESATFNDFGFFTISGDAYLLASRNSSTFNTVSPPTGFDGQTDWQTQGYTFTTGGSYTLGFGVFNVGDSGHNSVLLLDAITIPVPEPSSLALFLVGGFAAMLCAGRRS